MHREKGHKVLKRDWEGRHVRLLRDMQTNGGEMFKAGEVMLVHRNFGGLELWAIYVCPHCNRGYRAMINKVDEKSVVLLDEDYKPASQRDYAAELLLAQGNHHTQADVPQNT